MSENKCSLFSGFTCTEPVLKIMDAGYCFYVHIFTHILSHLNRLILTIILINSCQTSGLSKVGAIIKYNIMHFPVLIKTVLKLVYNYLQESHSLVNYSTC